MSISRVLIISPAFNESKMLPDFVAAFLRLRATISEHTDLRLLVIDDGSIDNTSSLLNDFSTKHVDCISYISFTANFGHQAALVAGLMNAGKWPQAIITMDCDLEHPIELVPSLIEKWRNEKCLLVNTIRKPAAGLGYLKKTLSKIFYRLTAKMTGLSLVPGQADFRLWDAGAIHSLYQYLPHVGSLRVFASWLPCKKGSLSYEQHLQKGRKSRFTFAKNVELAIMSIIRFSSLPLKSITFLGTVGLAFSFFYVIFILISRASNDVLMQGWTSLILTVIIMSCLQLICLGILASYFRRLVFSKDLPLFIIQKNSNNSWEK
ncbi:MAG: hypothetical protein COV43_00820 [Deltaproteobacteria bacterium CG11_big_fil_rev_8_21_14_0_20_42_23]|nr:MAG: hypothetical protein COV43_00820 [Deltaproteobacteria bacterium CG11_big_fil_rev_8_21_14_0_20_42_23]PJC64558.1 MAG: hypothetical protein CO021_03805 [Deltaproteobacteria bacterium CG_4_9_14_0_2_um_filter_42_21]